MIDGGDHDVFAFLGRLIDGTRRRRVRSRHRGGCCGGNRIDRRHCGDWIGRGNLGAAVAQINRRQPGDGRGARFGRLAATGRQTGSGFGQRQFDAGRLIARVGSDVVAGDQRIIRTPDATGDLQQCTDRGGDRGPAPSDGPGLGPPTPSSRHRDHRRGGGVSPRTRRLLPRGVRVQADLATTLTQRPGLRRGPTGSRPLVRTDRPFARNGPDI